MNINRTSLQIAMAEAGMTITCLSKKAKVSRVTIGKLINGNAKTKPAIVGMLARALDVDVESLIDKS